MIRQATIKDLEDILHILSDAKQFLKESGSTQWNGPNDYLTEDIFINDIKKKLCFVCERDGKVAGMATFAGYEKEYDKPFGTWLTNSMDYTTIHRIAVSSEFRSHGVATELMKYAEAYTKSMGRKSIRIDTHPENLIIQTMLRTLKYQNCGYVIYSYIPIEPKRLIYEKIVK